MKKQGRVKRERDSLFTRIKNKIFRRGMSLSDLDKIMDQGTRIQTSSGVHISNDIALTYSAFFNGVQQISQTVASLPCILYIKTGELSRRKYTEHPLFNVLRYQTNDETNAFNYIESALTHLICWGNHYAWIMKDGGGRIAGLRQLNPEAVEVKRNPETKEIEYFLQDEGQQRQIPKDRMFHIPGLGFDGVKGFSVLKIAADSIGLGISYQRFAGKFFANGVTPSGIFKHPETMTDEAKKNFKKAVRGAFSNTDGTDSRGMMVLENGMEFQGITMPLEDAQFLQSMTWQVTDIARFLNMPPHKLKELSRATFDNIQSEQISYLQDTIRPWLVRIEYAINTQLLNKQQRGKVFSEFMFEALLRSDVKTQNEALQIMRQNSVLTVDEWRAKLNMNPVGGKMGETLLMPKNMTAVNINGKPIFQPEEKGGDDADEQKIDEG